MNAFGQENVETKKKDTDQATVQKGIFKSTTVGTSREPHGQKNNGTNARRTDAAPHAKLSVRTV